jgi:hypothetical protein
MSNPPKISLTKINKLFQSTNNNNKQLLNKDIVNNIIKTLKTEQNLPKQYSSQQNYQTKASQISKKLRDSLSKYSRKISPENRFH